MEELTQIASASVGRTGITVAIMAAAISTGSFVRKIYSWKDRNEAARNDREAKFLAKDRSKDALLQLEFERAFGTLATVPEIKAIRAHGSNVLGMARAYGRGAQHVQWDESWFIYKNEASHKRGRLIAMVMFFTSLICAFTASVYAVSLLSSAGTLAILFGVIAVLTALSSFLQFRELVGYNAARHLINGRPRVLP